MRTRRDFLTPAIVFFGVAIVILFLWIVIADAQTHTMPGSNVVPSGASLTINSGGSITAAAGSTVTGFGAGGGAPTTSTYITQTPDAGLSAELALSTLSTGLLKSTTTTGALTTITDNSTNWNTAFTQMLQWDGGSTNLVAATGRTSLGGTTVGQSFFTLANPSAITFPEISATNVVSTKTAAQLKTDLSLTSTDVGLGSVTNNAQTQASIVPNTAPGGGQILAGNVGGTAYAPVTVSGSGATISLASTGVMTISAIANASLANSPLQWDGGSTNLVAATGRTSLGLVIGTNVEAWSANLDAVSSASATSGKILQAGGTTYGASTPTWPTAAGAVGYTIRSDATNFASYPAQLVNSSTASQSPSTSDVYLAGSNIVVTAGDFKAKGQYKCVFDISKTAGTGAIVITLRVGTAGTTADAAIQTYTFAAGTSVADLGMFEVVATWRTVGSGTSAVMQGMCRATHQLTTTGLISNAAGWMVLGSPSPSSGFNSSTATTIGLSFNGATSFAGTNTLVQSQLQQ